MFHKPCPRGLLRPLACRRECFHSFLHTEAPTNGITRPKPAAYTVSPLMAKLWAVLLYVGRCEDAAATVCCAAGLLSCVVCPCRTVGRFSAALQQSRATITGNETSTPACRRDMWHPAVAARRSGYHWGFAVLFRKYCIPSRNQNTGTCVVPPDVSVCEAAQFTRCSGRSSYSSSDAQVNIPRHGALSLLPPGSADAHLLHSGRRRLPRWRQLASLEFVFVVIATASTARTTPAAPDAFRAHAGSRNPPPQSHRGRESEHPATQAFLPRRGVPAGGRRRRRRRSGAGRYRNLGSRACC